VDKLAAVQRGQDAEAWVADQLVAEGWDVLARNWRGGGGEIDVIVAREGAVQFVEVRGWAEGGLVPMEETIDAGKRRRLASAARAWLAANREPTEVSFLVVFVHMDREPWSATWIDNAFDVGG
jgi:putative endonuclease